MGTGQDTSAGWLTAMGAYIRGHQAKLAGLATFVLVLFVGVVTFQTVAGGGVPMTTSNETARATRHLQMVAVTYERDVDVRKPFVAHVSRYMVQNESGEQILIPGSIETYKEGQHHIARTFFLPPDLKPGTWCIHAVLAWTPFMAMSTHYFDAPPVCFHLPPKGATHAPVN